VLTVKFGWITSVDKKTKAPLQHEGLKL